MKIKQQLSDLGLNEKSNGETAKKLYSYIELLIKATKYKLILLTHSGMFVLNFKRNIDVLNSII
ncbi:hypothetical protein [Mammaliicoccus sciuri]|uniref:hypothetical protein n=2 Tax=Mammaliicoccus TaxID=2803850 RepID=UPI00289E4979|nr:hypothetical protein [Mammaliicoccus sciuri]